VQLLKKYNETFGLKL